FVNNSSLGLYPAVVGARESLQKSGYAKLSALIWASLEIIMRFPRLRLDLRPTTGSALRRNTPMLFVGNNAYEASLTRLGTRTSLDQGRLWVMMPTVSSRWGLMSSVVALLAGRENISDLFTCEVTNLIVASHRRLLKVANDGEVLQLQPPLNY